MSHSLFQVSFLVSKLDSLRIHAANITSFVIFVIVVLVRQSFDNLLNAGTSDAAVLFYVVIIT